VINERSAYVLTDMMRGVVNHGTGAGANIGRPAAGKTGTTNDYKDAWFVGFTPDLAAGVWMGFDSDGYLNGVTGGTIPATIWHDFMSVAVANMPVRDFPRPSGIVSATISPKDGLLSPDPKSKDAQNEIFIEGTQPTKPSTGQGPNNRTDQPGDSQSGDKTLPPPPTRPDKPNAPSPPVPPQKTDQQKRN
jgi:penicillin-binding protein 1A